jgi:hypothetical protein
MKGRGHVRASGTSGDGPGRFPWRDSSRLSLILSARSAKLAVCTMPANAPVYQLTESGEAGLNRKCHALRQPTKLFLSSQRDFVKHSGYPDLSGASQCQRSEVRRPGGSLTVGSGDGCFDVSTGWADARTLMDAAVRAFVHIAQTGPHARPAKLAPRPLRHHRLDADRSVVLSIRTLLSRLTFPGAQR